MPPKATNTILDRIVERKLERLNGLRIEQSIESLKAQYDVQKAQGTLPAISNFAKQLIRPGSLGVIAEIKKASPSKGLIQPDFHPDKQAKAYLSAGVSAISVLTEQDFFLGSDDDLRLVHRTVDLPVLRKDFVVEPGQIYEARLMGASAILLICALLDDQTLADYLALANHLGLDALVETHDEAELEQALASGARIIGINNRDLKTFEVDLATTEKLAAKIPADRIIVAESGLMKPEDVLRVYEAGASAVLIGESLMRAAGTHETVASRLTELLGALPT